MSAEENKELIRHLITAYERHDLETFWRGIDPQGNFPVLKRFGIDPTYANYHSFMTAFLEALPDVHHTFEDMVAEGERVWVSYTIWGTHEGMLRNVPATHKPVTYSLIAMYRFAHGKIVEADFLADNLSLLQQLGVIAE
ncbi:hypothetical protein EPA93_00140 [Ktedonosporobacter rubrisoli]|uniref:Ester cyclase n=1 Tax=Ktedonosporobacter rubrisoli TaxID=2509675 RepID=A0A4P6JIL5_KTERU|nr:ester cyclase [Ktedonosporobacter rubrisoli]QBD74486.1 hypothetical protein EPA93_00140 [Ktedonosporobacter rubrisoli]